MFLIRKAEIIDIDEIKELYRNTILTINIKDYTLEQAEMWVLLGDKNEFWEERINNHYFLVAKKEEKIVGIASLRLDGYLNSVFVHKDYQNQGIASQLLEEIILEAKNKEIAEISADVNISAESYFEKQGFQMIEKQTICIGLPMDNYKMIIKI